MVNVGWPGITPDNDRDKREIERLLAGAPNDERSERSGGEGFLVCVWFEGFGYPFWGHRCFFLVS